MYDLVRISVRLSHMTSMLNVKYSTLALESMLSCRVIVSFFQAGADGENRPRVGEAHRRGVHLTRFCLSVMMRV